MEDQKASNSQIQKETEKKIFDLTSDMALEDQDNADIIDLTNAIETPETLATDDASTSASALINPADETDKAVEGDTDATTPTPESQDSDMAAGQSHDAAGAVPLFDQLSSITQQVDNALEAPDARPAFSAETPEPFDAPESDDEAVMAPNDTVPPEEVPDDDDVMELTDIVQPDEIPDDDAVMELTDIVQTDEIPDDDAVMELTDIVQTDEIPDDDAVMELTDIVQPDEIPDDDAVMELTDIVQPDEIPDDDAVVELTDIVQPDEIPDDDAVMELTDIVKPDDVSDDDEVMELTDIVQPDEIPDDDEILELTDIVQPDDISDDDEILELTDIAQPDEISDDDAVMELTDIAQPAESEALDTLYLNEVVEPEPADEAPMEEEPELSPDLGVPLAEYAAPEPELTTPDDASNNALGDEDDQIIQLSDILNQPNRGDKPSMAEVKVGAEEDLEAAPIPIEREVEANGLGLDMVEDAALEQKIRAVVEKVLRDNFAETIEPLISRAVVDAVRREMKSMKSNLPENDQS